MKIGNDRLGFEISYSNGRLRTSWWRPIDEAALSEDERCRLQLTGKISTSRRWGATEIGRVVTKVEQ